MIGYPFNSHVAYDEHDMPIFDRAISSVPLKNLIAKLFSNGVLPNPSTNLQVVSGGEGMTVIVKAGFCIINGGLKLEDEDKTLVVQASDNTHPRIDTVVMRWNDNDDVRACDLYIVEGTPSASPVRPNLTRTESIYEIGLADIYITARSTSIDSFRITDTRLDTARCGYISSISEFDTSTLYAQIQSDLSNFQSEEQADFLAWFEEMRDQLSEDAAGNLQLQIDNVNGRYDGLTEDINAFRVVNQLPEVGAAGTLYLVTGEEETHFAGNVDDNKKIINDNVITTDSAFSSLHTSDLLNNKVDKEDGKGLSKNDFTDALKTKLDGLPSSFKTINGVSIAGEGNISITGGEGGYIESRNINTKRLRVTEDMNIENVASSESVWLYDNDNMCAIADLAEATSKGITYRVKDGLIYLNGTATSTLHIPVDLEVPAYLLNQTCNFFVEKVSGERSNGNVYVKTPIMYMSGSTEKQIQISTGNASLTYSKVIGFTTATEIQVAGGAVCTDLVLRPYIALRTSRLTPSVLTDLPTPNRHLVTDTIGGTTGILMTMSAPFTAEVKSKVALPKLFGKKMVSCGDSIAYGHGGDPYVYTIAEEQNMSYDKVAVGEARLSTVSPTRSITLQVTELTDDYDYILVEGGINDALNGSTIGELTSGFNAELDDTTVIGAVETICKFLVENYSNAKKLYILCHKTTNANYQPHAAQATYFEAIISALKKWNIPYIDLREYPLCGYNAYYAQTYFNQNDFTLHGGLHPNTAGYALGYVDQITSKMETI